LNLVGGGVQRKSFLCKGIPFSNHSKINLALRQSSSRGLARAAISRDFAGMLLLALIAFRLYSSIYSRHVLTLRRRRSTPSHCKAALRRNGNAPARLT